MKQIYSRIASVIVLILWFLALSMSVKAQKQESSVEQQGNIFVQKTSARGEATKTKYVYQDSKGNKDTIYISANGKAFIYKVSKKTGNVYRKYLPEITKILNNK